MKHIHGQFTANGKIDWQTSDTDSYEGEGVVLSFMVYSCGRKREALTRLSDFLLQTGIKWLRPIRGVMGEWLLDVEELRAESDLLEELDWLTGKVAVIPEYEVEQRGGFEILRATGVAPEPDASIQFVVTQDEMKSVMPTDMSALTPFAVILTALRVEYQAVRAHLTGLREEIHRQGTVYEWGSFSSHSRSWKVAIVEIGPGNPGAAMEAERAINHFDPSIAFFVGVAGGLKDVALGDVVAATRVYGYESGKAGTTFQTRADVINSTYRMVHRARAEARKEDWLQRLEGSVPDPKPNVLIGPIAAGEKVVASTRSAVWKFLRSSYNDALAVEMEGHGFLRAIHANSQVDALIIRGISDLIEGKSEADAAGHQETAARHASAFAFEILAKLEEVQSKTYATMPASISPLKQESATFIRLSFEPEMVLIPAGQFLMGSDPNVDENATDREQPQHILSLPEYYLAKTPVTNAQYAAFVQNTGHKPPPHWEGNQYPEGLGEHPVVNVRWSDAIAYCKWLSKKLGKPYRLPSEAEWEKAARETDGRRFPWGDEWDVSKCNTRESGTSTTTPVGQYSPDGDSPYGVADMAGNVWEWCADWLQPYPGNASPDDDYGETHKVLRGSSWKTYGLAHCAFRYARRPGETSDDIGFRCAKDSPATRVKTTQRFQEGSAKAKRVVVVQSAINEVVLAKRVIEHYNSREFSATSGAPKMPTTASEKALAPGSPDLAASKELVGAISEYLLAANSFNSLVDIHLTRGGSLEQFAMRQNWASLSEILDRLDDCLKSELAQLTG